MTLKECIDIVDNIKPNQYTVKDKVLWLSFIDEIIINDVLKTHEGYDGRYDDFIGYSEDKLSVALIVPSPYDRLYTAYLKMKIDGENGETARYNNSAVLFNSYMLEYRKFYNKTHMPLNNADKMVKPGDTNKHTVGLTDAEYESLKNELKYSLTEFFSDSVSSDKLYNAVYNYAQNNLEMLKGKDGETPIKGRDYFTEDEVNDIKADAKNQTIVDLRPDFSALDNKINKNSSDISNIEGEVNDIESLFPKDKNGELIEVASQKELNSIRTYLDNTTNELITVISNIGVIDEDIIPNLPKDADGNIIESASKDSVEAMKDLFPKDAEGNLKKIVEYEVAVSDEFAQGRFASVGDEVYEVVSDDGDFSVNMTVALETSNDPHGNARIKLKIPEGKWDIYILNQDDTSSTVMMYVNGNTVAYGSSNLVSNKFLRKIMEKEDYFSDEDITLDLFMMELGGSCSLDLYCAYVVDGKDGLLSSEDKAKLESLVKETATKNDVEALKEATEALDTKLTANILKGSASGEIVSMKDVSPTEHEMGVKVRGKNLVDLNNVYKSTYADYRVEDNKLIIKKTNTAENQYTNIFFYLGKCKDFANKTLTISATNESAVNFSIHLAKFNSNGERVDYVRFGTFKGSATTTYTSTVPDNDLDEVLCLRLVCSSTTVTGDEEFTFSDIQLEEGTVATAYAPYVPDISAVKLKVYEQNLLNIDAGVNGKSFVKNSDGTYTLIKQGGSRLTGKIPFDYPNTSFSLYVEIVDTNIDGLNGINTMFKNAEETKTQYPKMDSNGKCTLIDTGGRSGLIQLYIDNAMSDGSYITFKNAQIAVSSTPITEYKPYVEPIEYSVSAEGTSKVSSIHPTTTICADTDGVLIDCTYNRDINIAFKTIEDKITALSAAMI